MKEARAVEQAQPIEKTNSKEMEAPDRNDEYFLYQTLIGAFPRRAPEAEFSNDLKAYIVKAVREAKVQPNGEAGFSVRNAFTSSSRQF